MTSLLAFDFETHLIQPGLLAPPIVCGSYADQNLFTEGYIAPREEMVGFMETQLNDSRNVFVGANIAYDFGCLLAARPDLLPLVWRAYEESRVFDVLIAGTLDAIHDGRLRDDGGKTTLFLRNGKKVASGRYSLETVVEDYLGRVDAKKNDRFRLSYALLENIPIEQWPEEARQYPIDDAVNTLHACEVQLKECHNLHNLPAQAHAAFCAHLGAIWGLKTDPAKVEALKGEVDARLAEIQGWMQAFDFVKVGGTKKEPKLVKDTKRIKELVYKAYNGLPPTTEGGDIATSREALLESGDPDLVKLGSVSKWEKLRTYADTLASLGSTPYNVACNILLNTGRASYDGLVQLMPREGGVRECFVPRPGFVFCSVDYAAIEMSTLAQVCLWALGYSKLAEALNADLDPHSSFAATMLGEDYADFLAKKDAGDKRAKGYRQAAKSANFGFPGMMGGVTFVVAQKKANEKVCEWTHRDGQCGREKREYETRSGTHKLCVRCVEEAEKLRRYYLTQWPEMPNYFNWVSAQGESVEQFVSKRVRGGCSAPAAANTRFQGLAADGAKAAVVALTKEMYLDRQSPLFGSRLILFTHDETILEIPEERLHEASYRQAEVMISEMKRYVPDVKVKAEPAAMRYWTKKADKVLDANGRLTPWSQ